MRLNDSVKLFPPLFAEEAAMSTVHWLFCSVPDPLSPIPVSPPHQVQRILRGAVSEVAGIAPIQEVVDQDIDHA